MRTRSWWLVALLSTMVTSQAYAAAVGMVLDVNGSVRADVSGHSKVLDIATPLDPGTHIVLEKGSEIGFVFYPTRQKFTVVGPAALQISEQAVKQLQGVAMKSKDLPENRATIALGFQNSVRPAAGVMRALVVKPIPLEPQDGETVLSTRPEFVWTSGNGAPIDFSLTLDGALIHQQKIEGNWLVLPVGVVLLSGSEYRWQIASAASDKSKANWSTFTVASDSLRQQVQDDQPAGEAELADWVLYAMSLEELKIKTGASRVWKRVAEQRPTSEKLQKMLR